MYATRSRTRHAAFAALIRKTPYDTLKSGTTCYSIHVKELGENSYRLMVFIPLSRTVIRDEVVPGIEVGMTLDNLADYVDNSTSFVSWIEQLSFENLTRGLQPLYIEGDVLIENVVFDNCIVDISYNDFPWPTISLEFLSCRIHCGDNKDPNKKILLRNLNILNGCEFSSFEDIRAFRDFFDCVVFTAMEHEYVPHRALTAPDTAWAPIRVGDIESYLETHPNCIGVPVYIEDIHEGEQLIKVVKKYKRRLHAVQSALIVSLDDTVTPWFKNLTIKVREMLGHQTPVGFVPFPVPGGLRYSDEAVDAWGIEVLKHAYGLVT